MPELCAWSVTLTANHTCRNTAGICSYRSQDKRSESKAVGARTPEAESRLPANGSTVHVLPGQALLLHVGRDISTVRSTP